ncbi:hypothetical protein HOY82DRAFT_616060 [Tuber indicum]|nr:hypothetical protein HOY82DRAFT_616060 [Tuber indicum]
MKLVRSSKKLSPPKPLSPTKSPKIDLLTNPKARSIIGTTSSSRINNEAVPFLPPPLATMKLSAWLRHVEPEELLQIQGDNEGRLRLGKNDLLRYEYNFLYESFMIKCMPLPTHDSLKEFFTNNVSVSLAQRFGPSQARKLVTVASGTTFAGFTGDPSVVCEAGWAEDYEQLVQDARLWLLRTSGQTRVVIVLSFQENIPRAPTVIQHDETTTQNTSAEQALLDSINDTTDANDLADRLFTLNQEKKLKKPLVGKLEANLYVYKASEAADDIIETFSTKLLPPPPIDLADSSPKEPESPWTNCLETMSWKDIIQMIKFCSNLQINKIAWKQRSKTRSFLGVLFGRKSI